ncbi:hypothetical protein [Halovenus halobia]|uniref:hypothetical protein n=1 Tax=Halovenus halobia TaxID=3396622 RepID=UPI003F54354D
MVDSQTETPSRYFKDNRSAFQIVVRLGNTRPGEYEQEEIRSNIEEYARVTSLGDVHREGLQEIQKLLAKYKNTSENYPETKGYGVVGQYGDGKTHFLTAIHDLLSNDSDLVCPEDMRLLVLDPFQFTRNPADIVEALRERVKVELGPDASDRIPEVKTDETQDVIEDLIQQGHSREKAEEIFSGREVSGIRGEAAGHAFSSGCKETIQKEKYDAIVVLMDEIEGIARGEDIDYQDLDKYREFFDQIDADTPVMMVMTAPRDQWNRFESVHRAMMDRAFGPKPRQHTRLRPLNEEELAETWTERRNKYLVREDVSLPNIADNEYFPLHMTTLRAIHQIARRGNSNRTAIKLMEEAFETFLQRDDLRWVTPGDILTDTSARNTGEGGIFVRDQLDKLVEHDEQGILTSIAAVLQEGISEDELSEICMMDEGVLQERLESLSNGGWITRQRINNETIFQLHQDQISQLLNEEEQQDSGELTKTVATVMANTSEDDEFIYRNLARILREQPPFEADFVAGTYDDEDHYFLLNSTYGNFHDRRILVTTGDHSEEKLESLRMEQEAELVVTVNLSGRAFDSNRIYSINPNPLTQDWEYEVEELEYSAKQWICAYRQLSDKLEQGGHTLLSSIKSYVVGELLNIEAFQFGTSLSEQLETIYPEYPGPLEMMNGNALKAYREAIDEGLTGRQFSYDEIRDLGYAEGKQAIQDYINEWKNYDLVESSDSDSYTVEIKISNSENLILDAVKEREEGIEKSQLYSKLEKQGYPKEDIVQFVELLHERGKVRTENEKIQQTSNDLFEAREYLKAVEAVVEWLTDDTFPEDFRENNIQSRDELMKQLSYCNRELDRLKDLNNSSSVSNPVERLIEDITELQGLAIDTINSFENTTYAQELANTEKLITGIREEAPEEELRSDEFFNEVSDLNSVAANLSNGARGYIESNLTVETGDSVFGQLQALQDEFVDEFAKIGPYSDYSEETEIEKVITQFEETRPTPEKIRSAVRTVETFKNKTRYAKQICRIALEVRDSLIDIEEIEYEKYDIESELELAELAQEAVDNYEKAADEYSTLASQVSDISFSGLDEEKVDNLQASKQETDSVFTEARETKQKVDQEITQQASEISSAVGDMSTAARKIDSDPSWAILSKIKTPEVRTEAQEWRSDFEGFVENLEQSSDEVLKVRPSTVEELSKMIERYEKFKSSASEFEPLAKRILEIEDEYFESEKDSLPPGKLEEVKSLRNNEPGSEPSDQVHVSLDRIEAINQALEIDIGSKEERIQNLVRARESITPDELVEEVPEEAFQETPKEIAEALNALIRDGELALGYNGNVIMT